MTDFPIGIFFGILALIAWGTSDFFATHSTRNIGPIRTYFWSQIFALLFYAIAFFVLFFSIPQISILDWALVIAMTASFIFGFHAFYKGFEVGKVGIVSPIANAWPAIAVLFALIVLGQSLTQLQTAAVSVVFVGGMLSSFRVKDLLKLKLKNAEVGAGFALVGTILFAAAFILLDPLVAALGFFMPIFLHKVIQPPMLAGYARALGRNLSFPRSIAVPIILIGLMEFSGFMAYTFAIETEFTALIAPLIAAIPMVTVLLARIFFKETLSLNQWIGGVLIIGGIAVLSV